MEQSSSIQSRNGNGSVRERNSTEIHQQSEVVLSQGATPSSHLKRDCARSRILNKFLAVSLAILDGKVPEKEINEIVQIIFDDDFDEELFRSDVGSLSKCKKITKQIIKTCREG